jgi:phospholipid/cholesterol/gamma-HCH transport system ATP-binding protein
LGLWGGALTVASVILDLKNVEVSFGAEVILQNVNIKIAKGERVSVIGPSGQGKSVLLKTMGGLIRPTKGTVIIEGENWSELVGQKLREILAKVGMLFQKNALFDSLTCGENIAFPLREVSDHKESEIQKIVVDFLEAVGIPHALHLYPDEISGGMQKRLGIARALALEPHVIFYDDPTAGLDPITSKKIIELICEWQKRLGSTFVAITNDMNRAYQMSDRILMVVDREVIEAGTPKSILTNPDPRVHQFIRGELRGPLTALA